ncbi:YhdH/YhfP family quinone oxidoreductase [Desulfolithobacter sp.]
MLTERFPALLVSAADDKTYVPRVALVSLDDLPAVDVLIKVHYSSLNYKDALSANGNRGVTRRYPHVPGIDAAGVVVESASDRFAPGDRVLCCGYDLGMNTWGGFSSYIRVPSDWVMAAPGGLSLKQTMEIGTAGFTAAGCVFELLESDCRADCGSILVTGATGGVGCVAVALLAKLGFKVAAVTGKSSEHAFLQRLGADTVIDRDKMSVGGTKKLLRERWAGVVDTVGGDILATAIKQCRYGGVVTCCGNAASGELPLNVYPFILRAVRLIGVDSATCVMERREQLWELLAGPWRLDCLGDLSQTLTLNQLPKAIDSMLHGLSRGRIVVSLLEQ